MYKIYYLLPLQFIVKGTRLVLSIKIRNFVIMWKKMSEPGGGIPLVCDFSTKFIPVENVFPYFTFFDHLFNK